MKRLIDVASGSDPTIGDLWDNFEPPSRVQDIGNNTSDWQEDGFPPRFRQQLCVVEFSEQLRRISR